MAIIRPFQALRPTDTSAHLIASVPYDVVNREEAKKEAGDNELNFLRVTRSEIELDDLVNSYSTEVYQKAKENLKKLVDEKQLVLESKPCFYLYKLEMNGKTQTGITATFSVDDYNNNVILKHEKTRKEKEDDRTNHIVTTEAQTGVVFLTYRGVDPVNELVNSTMEIEKPLYHFTASDGIVHTVWIVPEKYNDTIINEIGNVEKLYIADGHHRAASASRAQKVMQERNSNHNGNEEYNFFIGVLFPAEQLNILPYNRVVFDLNGLSRADFLTKISEHFSIEETYDPNPPARRNYCMYIDNVWYLLKARDTIKPSLNHGDNLDVGILQNYLLNPVLGVGDPRTSKKIDFVGGIRGTAELEKLVNSGKAAVAFSLYPLSVDDLMNISDAGEIMPPKSTWFEPKLRDGLLVHLIST